MFTYLSFCQSSPNIHPSITQHSSTLHSTFVHPSLNTYPPFTQDSSTLYLMLIHSSLIMAEWLPCFGSELMMTSGGTRFGPCRHSGAFRCTWQEQEPNPTPSTGRTLPLRLPSGFCFATKGHPLDLSALPAHLSKAKYRESDPTSAEAIRASRVGESKLPENAPEKDKGKEDAPKKGKHKDKSAEARAKRNRKSRDKHKEKKQRHAERKATAAAAG